MKRTVGVEGAKTGYIALRYGYNHRASADELAAVIAAVRRTIADDRYPLSPRLAPLKSALAKLDPGSVPKPAAERPPMRSRGGRRARR